VDDDLVVADFVASAGWTFWIDVDSVAAAFIIESNRCFSTGYIATASSSAFESKARCLALVILFSSPRRSKLFLVSWRNFSMAAGGTDD